MNLGDAMGRARVLDVDLQRKLRPHMQILAPLPSIFDASFIAANQASRADHVKGGTKAEQVAAVRADIRAFKAAHCVDTVIVLWTANTERYSLIDESVHGSEAALRAALERNEPELAPSTLFGLACVDEGVPFINGSPQNTFVPGCAFFPRFFIFLIFLCFFGNFVPFLTHSRRLVSSSRLIEAATRAGVLIAGDDFKSGQTKMKSVLVDFLVSAGLKPVSIVSYNHLGNNDGRNLSEPDTFRSKEISKSNVVDDMVASNALLYGPGEHPDHVVVIKARGGLGLGVFIKNLPLFCSQTFILFHSFFNFFSAQYVPSVGDSKRAMDEYTSDIFMCGRNTIAMHNTCEDSLLASPLILDLVLLAELLTRLSLKKEGEPEFHSFHPVAVLLSYLTKAPLYPAGVPVVNALAKQRCMLENVLRAAVGLPPDSCMHTAVEGAAGGELRPPKAHT